VALEDLVMRPEIQLTLAEAIVRAKGDALRARGLAEAARAGYAHAGDERREAIAARWIAGHGR
jgi:hypothetical protein